MGDNSGLVKKGALERIGEILISNHGVCFLVNSLVILFNTLNTGPFAYSIPLSLLTTFAMLGVVVVGPRVRPGWTAFQPENRLSVLLGVVLAANIAALLPFHPKLWEALKCQVFIVLPLYCMCIMYEFLRTKVVDEQMDEQASLLA